MSATPFPFVLPVDSCLHLDMGWRFKPLESSSLQGRRYLSKRCFDFSPYVCSVTHFSGLYCTLSVYPCMPSLCLCSPSSFPLWQLCGILFIRCRLRALNYSDQLFPESEKTCARGRSAARCPPSFLHLWISAAAVICTDAVWWYLLLSEGIRCLGLHLSWQQDFDCVLLILLPKN